MAQYLLRCCNVVTTNPSFPCIKYGNVYPFAEELDKDERVVILAKNFSKDNLSEKRPWGGFTVLLDEEGYKVKKLVINPSGKLSLQLHRQRDEHWFVLSGAGLLTLGNTTKEIAANDVVTVEKYTVHSVSCLSEKPLVLIEIQTGKCNEEDIVRLEDKYGRT